MVQLSHPYMTTGKAIALTIQQKDARVFFQRGATWITLSAYAAAFSLKKQKRGVGLK